LTFFALENDSRVLCYANANLTRADQAGEPMRFVDFWHELTGSDPQWLYIDSKVMTYPELSRLNQRGICFVTIRRRGAAILRRLARLPAGAWQRAVIDTPKRLVIGIGMGFSRTSGDRGQFCHSAGCGLFAQAACSTRARSSSDPARPYIVRLITFSRFTWPSTGPLLQASLRPACTAASS